MKHPNSFFPPTSNTRNHFHNNDTFLSLSLSLLGWLTLSAMLSLSATAQTLVNRAWVAQYGLPDTVAWSASTADGSGHLYTTGNTFVPSQGADVLLTRYDPEGNLLWQQTYDHQGQNDYGVAILHHANGELTVAAALHDATDSFDVGLLRYDGSGNLLWSYSYDYQGQYDVPTALAEDANGNLYVCAASLGSSTDLDYLTLKVKADGTFEWMQSYDFAAGRDVPVSLVVDGSDITVTGASEDSTGQWDFYTVMYDDNGTVMEEYRLDKPGIGFDEPAGIARDAAGNFYLTGRASDNGTDYYIQTVKLDAQLNLLWEVSYAHSGQDGATGLGLDSQGNVYVCGYLAEPTGQELILLKYDPNGNLLWDRTETSESGGAAAATHLHIGAEDQIFVTGYQAVNSQQRLYVAAFDTEGKKLWARSVEDGDYAGGEILTQGTDAYVSAKSFSNGTYQYVAVKYAFWDASTGIVLDSAGTPRHTKDEVIVKFAPEALYPDVFSTTDVVFGNVSRFVRPELLDEIEGQSGLANIRQAYAYKVLPRLTVADSLSVTRLGDTLILPYLWTSLVLKLPEPVSTVRSSGIWEEDAATSMEQVYPYVWYAEPNYISQLTTIPNDDKYDNKQESLHGDSYPGADINVEPAWAIETGKPHVRVGVFDSGIRWSHNDLCDRNRDQFSESRVKGGWNYIDDVNIESDKDNDDSEVSHGTKVAGIIGAVRNNNKGIAGIAGIAGGNDDSEPGVSLYAMKVGRPLPDGRDLIENVLATAAIVDGALFNPSRDVGMGLHIANHSWSGPGSNSVFNAINTAYRHSMTTIVSVGNDGIPAPAFPGRYSDTKDHYVIAAAATGDDGNFVVAGVNNGGSNYTSNWGPAVDIVAPGIRDLVFTIDEGPRGLGGGLIYQDDHSYHWFDGTSAAAPHVAGVAALMMSYHNDPQANPDNLSPEDVEEMMERYPNSLPNSTVNAPILTTTSPNELTGHGRINAGVVMLALIPPHDLWHYEHETSIGGFTLTQTNAVIDFAEGALSTYYTSNATSPVILPAATVPLQQGEYVVDVYRYTATVPHNLAASSTILDSWTRGSSSDVLLAPQPQAGTSVLALSGDPGFVLSNVTPASATIEGYVYDVKSTLGGTPINTWFPFDPDTEQGRFAWTLHTIGATVSTPSLELSSFRANLYPNPVASKAYVSIEGFSGSQVHIDMLDATGSTVRQWDETIMDRGKHSFAVDVSYLPTGLYLVRISNPHFSTTLKLIKP